MSSRRKDAEVFEPKVDALFDAAAALRRNYAERLRRSRPCAGRHFDERDCMQHHEELYAGILGMRR
jgi:hypothetical protein